MAPSAFSSTARLLPLVVMAGLFLAGCALPGIFTRPGEEPGEPMGRIAVRYEVSEQDVRHQPPAFHVWRSMKREGPFERITRAPIALPGDARPGMVALLHVDRGVPLGAEAWYYLEAVQEDGTSRKATAVSRAVALLPSEYEDSKPLVRR